METDDILSFSTPLPPGERVETRPAPVLELDYAYYYLLARAPHNRDDELPWVAELRSEDPQLIDEFTSFWQRFEFESSGYDLFLLAGELGYARDEDTARFLDDLPELPARLLQRFDAAQDGHDPDDEEPERQKYEALRHRLERLRDPDTAALFRDLLVRLWQRLAPHWEREGRAKVEEASRSFRREFEQSGDVLKALPPHHFTQFEVSAAQIRLSQDKGRILVVPLYFAAGGGFNFEMGQSHFIGYGLRTEDLFEDSALELTELAGRFKAFSDPTRLMLLAFIARWHRMPLTVGDLAVQLGVSQPTVSGHLKILREAGLVTVERKGNRSFHRIDAASIRTTLTDMEEALLEFLPER